LHAVVPPVPEGKRGLPGSRGEVEAGVPGRRDVDGVHGHGLPCGAQGPLRTRADLPGGPGQPRSPRKGPHRDPGTDRARPHELSANDRIGLRSYIMNARIAITALGLVALVSLAGCARSCARGEPTPSPTPAAPAGAPGGPAAGAGDAARAVLIS